MVLCHEKGLGTCPAFYEALQPHLGLYGVLQVNMTPQWLQGTDWCGALWCLLLKLAAHQQGSVCVCTAW